ncbi:MAG: hypothetical protein IKE42_29875, partial [Aquamicrobium sp.]|nr:hypothetical protein [Aquamicrobium sp.]
VLGRMRSGIAWAGGEVMLGRTAKGLVPGHIGSAGAMKLRQENGVAICIGGAFGDDVNSILRHPRA